MPSIPLKDSETTARGSLWMGKHSVNLLSSHEDRIDYGVLTDQSVFGIPGWQFTERPSDSKYSIVYYPDKNSFYPSG